MSRGLGDVYKRQELAGHTGTPAAHDRAFLDAGIFDLQLFDELPEHGFVGGGHQGFLRADQVVMTESIASTIFLTFSIPWSKTNSSPSRMVTTACFSRPFFAA